jgi:hypothetical protein
MDRATQGGGSSFNMHLKKCGVLPLHCESCAGEAVHSQKIWVQPVPIGAQIPQLSLQQ